MVGFLSSMHPHSGCFLLLYIHLCLYEQQGTRIYKNISLILFSKGAHRLSLVWEIDGETYTQRGDFFLSHIFWEPGGAKTCTPLQAVSSELSEMPLISYLSLAWLPILWILSKSDCMVLISCGFLPVIHLLDWPAPSTAIPLFINHNMTACQSTWGH